MMSTNGPARPSSRRNFLIASVAGIAAAGATYSVAADPPQSDPIFELITKENEAWEAFVRVCYNDKRAPGEHAAASQIADDAMLAVCEGSPTTLAGLVAVLALFEERAHDSLDNPYVSQLAGIVAGARSLARRA